MPVILSHKILRIHRVSRGHPPREKVPPLQDCGIRQTRLLLLLSQSRRYLSSQELQIRQGGHLQS